MVFYPGQPLFGGRYIIQRELGQGGIGITYLAKNQRGELRVIKTLRQEILNRPDLIQHQNKLKQDFRDEGLRLALCRHPHIVEVENVFDEATLPCMVMEYINGEDLGKRITEKGALPEAEALLYIQQIGDALTLVHEKGLLHRDLKPNNIMIRAGKQEAVLIDFGIARQFVSGAVQQHTENLTPGYAPPEQYLPDAERGEYIDVYALAATLYALLTGQLPMPAPARLQNFTLPPPKDFNSSISDKVNEAVMKGMALNYQLRPQSVQKWLELLDYDTPEWKFSKTIVDNSGKFAISPDGKILAVIVGSSINLLEFPTEKVLETLIGHSKLIESIVFSPSGKLLVSSSQDKTIKFWQISTGKAIHTLSGKYLKWGINSITFSPNGKILATVTGDWNINLWEITTYRTIDTFYSWSGCPTHIIFSTDGNILALCISDKSSRRWSMDFWQVPKRKFLYNLERKVSYNLNLRSKLFSWIFGFPGLVNSIAFNPNGNVLATGMSVDTIKIWDVNAGKEIQTMIGHSGSVNCITFSPDGLILVSGSSDKTIKMWDMLTGKKIRTMVGHSESVNCIAFSPDGQFLISGDKDGNIKIWQRG